MSATPLLIRPDITRYWASHRSLLHDVRRVSVDIGDRTGRAAGGVVLPVSRSFRQQLPGLELATRLALSQGCPLLVLCSQKADPEAFPRRLRQELGEQLVLVPFNATHADWNPRLNTDRLKINRYHRHNDASRKRNLGLVVASLLNWSWLLLLDDDISPDPADDFTLDERGLDRALAVLARATHLRAIGWTAVGEEDHSVIGHARKFTRMRQDVFIGAGALLLRCEERLPFFPSIYNHDWLFLFSLAVGAGGPRSVIGVAGQVEQCPDARWDVGRARSQEGGEVLGECLLNVFELLGPQCRDLLGDDFWQEALAARRALIRKLIRRTQWLGVVARGLRREAELAYVALTASSLVAASLTVRQLQAFLHAWEADAPRWGRHLDALGSGFFSEPDPRAIFEALRRGKPPSSSTAPALVRPVADVLVQD
jgi:hypothetical protein